MERIRILLVVLFLLIPTAVHADICGCEGNPDSLGAFNASSSSTYPPGTTRSGTIVTIPLPADGILIFTNFTIPQTYTVKFQHNAANTPVTLLISGNMIFGSYSYLRLDGEDGRNGSIGGSGALGAPGGFRGGEGAEKRLNGESIGGAGGGPGGGLGIGGANTNRNGISYPGYWTGASAAYVGSPDMMPLIGGSGGGGGNSTDENRADCTGGGGGGGGGAILIAVNGTLDLGYQSTISAKGGNGGSYWYNRCSGGGGGGSGGGIRLIANAISGSGGVYTTGGRSGSYNYYDYGEDGVIRMEAYTNTLPMSGPATRLGSPGPVNGLTALPTVKITNVHGQVVNTPPVGVFGGVDVYVSTAGMVTIDLESTGVPRNTEIIVTAKARVGADPVFTTAVNDSSNCDQAGVCSFSATFTLAPGIYFVEAEATFILAAQ